MSIAQVRASRVRGKNYRRKNGPKPVPPAKAARRLRQKLERAQQIAQRKAQKKR